MLILGRFAKNADRMGKKTQRLDICKVFLTLSGVIQKAVRAVSSIIFSQALPCLYFLILYLWVCKPLLHSHCNTDLHYQLSGKSMQSECGEVIMEPCKRGSLACIQTAGCYWQIQQDFAGAGGREMFSKVRCSCSWASICSSVLSFPLESWERRMFQFSEINIKKMR